MTERLRLFLSYGHDGNAPLVTRISRDLEARGHDVWIDQTSMKEGQHWRRTILDGIQNSSGVVAFLSKHSTRVPGACLDELRIAVSLPGVNIATVLMEPEEQVKPPGIIAEIQWLDLSGWRDEQAKGDESFEAWYAERFARLCAALESPETKTFVGEITELRERLRPIVLDQKERELLDSPYVGREWLRKALDDWRVNKPESKAFVVLGTPGAGKSAFAVRTLWDDPYAVCGILIEWDKAITNDPRQVIRTMAFKLAARLPDYRKLLLDSLRDLSNLDGAGVAELLAWLITQPLSYCPSTDRERVYIVLDALDEAPDERIAEVIKDNLLHLPRWIGVVLTARPRPHLVELFRDYQPIIIDADNSDNLSDIKQYLRLSMPEGTSARSVASLASSAEGSFLYAKLLVTSGGLHPSGELPKGLTDVYRQWFSRAFPTRESYVDARKYLELVLADPILPVEALVDASGGDQYAFLGFRDAMGELIVDRGHLEFCHKSVPDWLKDESSSGRFFVDARLGARRMVKYTAKAHATALRSNDWSGPIWDHLSLQRAGYYRLTGQWREYHDLLLSETDFRRLDTRRLWIGCDSFPASWDTSDLVDKFKRALWYPWDRVTHGYFAETRTWAYLLEVFRDAIETPRLAEALFDFVSGVPLSGFFRSAASDENDFFSANKTRFALQLVQSMRRCQEKNIVVDADLQDRAAEIVMSSAYCLGRGIADTLRGELRRNPELFSMGLVTLDGIRERKSGLTGDDVGDMCSVFNTCAAVYELWYAPETDVNRLRQLVSFGVEPETLAAYGRRELHHIDVEQRENHVQSALNAVLAVQRWHPEAALFAVDVCPGGQGLAYDTEFYRFPCCGTVAPGDYPSQYRLDGCEPMPAPSGKGAA